MQDISADSSVSIPHTFFLLTTMSLGHFICDSRPVTSVIALDTAIAATKVSIDALSGAISGFIRNENHIPVPGGDTHAWPLLPLPAVCSSATASSPCHTPLSACLFNSLLVESIESKYNILLPSHSVWNKLLSSCSEITSGASRSL